MLVVIDNVSMAKKKIHDDLRITYIGNDVLDMRNIMMRKNPPYNVEAAPPHILII